MIILTCGRFHIVRRSDEQHDQTLLLTGVLPEFGKSAESLKAALEAADLFPLSVIKQEGKVPVFYVRIQSGCLDNFRDVILSKGIARHANRSSEAVNAIEGEEKSKLILVSPVMLEHTKKVDIEVLGFIGTFLQQHLAIESFLQGSTEPRVFKTIMNPGRHYNEDLLLNCPTALTSPLKLVYVSA